MCGIVGYVGNREKREFILNGLKELEYRGYDSAGMAVMSLESGCDKCAQEIAFFKAIGKLETLAKKSEGFSSSGDSVAIGHTRWATHGTPTEINTHPHLGEHSVVVHNSMIENYQELKEHLAATG